MVMTESWQLYSYLQRWWRLLLICSALGVLVAYLVNEPTVYANEYYATGTVAILDDKSAFELVSSKPKRGHPESRISFTSGPASSMEEAEALTEAKFSQLSQLAGTPVERRGIVIDERPLGTWAWWKGTTLGAVIGFLAAIGLVYVWNDFKAHSIQSETT